MTKEQLIERQISIKEKQTELHNETQKLLWDILTRMTTEQKNKLNGYVINDDYTISDNVTMFGFNVEEYDGEVSHKSIEDLSQIEQKELIDFILSSINNLID
jgi:trans-2-enoyl-CoA reductase